VEAIPDGSPVFQRDRSRSHDLSTPEVRRILGTVGHISGSAAPLGRRSRARTTPSRRCSARRAGSRRMFAPTGCRIRAPIIFAADGRRRCLRQHDGVRLPRRFRKVRSALQHVLFLTTTGFRSQPPNRAGRWSPAPSSSTGACRLFSGNKDNESRPAEEKPAPNRWLSDDRFDLARPTTRVAYQPAIRDCRRLVGLICSSGGRQNLWRMVHSSPPDRPDPRAALFIVAGRDTNSRHGDASVYNP